VVTMLLEPIDQHYLKAAQSYVELGMFMDADAGLDEIDPFCRIVPEVLAMHIAIYRGLENWGVMQTVAARMVEFSDDAHWVISLRLRDPKNRIDSGGQDNFARSPQRTLGRRGNPLQSGLLRMPVERFGLDQAILERWVRDCARPSHGRVR
jgi:hypothetical protein